MAATKEMQAMSEKELIANIVKCDEQGKDLETYLKMAQELKCVPEEDIQKGIILMEQLALARAEMKRLLVKKYGVFIM